MHVRIAAGIVVSAACFIGCDEPDAGSRAAPQRAPAQAAAIENTAAPEDAAQAKGRKQWDRPPEMQIDPAKNYVATIKTNMGEFKAQLFAKDAPKTVNNFVFLAKNDFYDGTIFHRVINDFMIQGGDPTGTGTGGPGYQFEDETRGNPNKHASFTLSMANAGPNTNGSQFFITEVTTPHLNGKHTVFGRVIEGMEVVEAISDVPTGLFDRPVKDVVIEDVTIEEKVGDQQAATKPAG